MQHQRDGLGRLRCSAARRRRLAQGQPPGRSGSSSRTPRAGPVSGGGARRIDRSRHLAPSVSLEDQERGCASPLVPDPGEPPLYSLRRGSTHSPHHVQARPPTAARGRLGPRRPCGPVRNKDLVGSSGGHTSRLAGDRSSSRPADAPSKMPPPGPADRPAYGKVARRHRGGLLRPRSGRAIGVVPGGSGELGDEEPVSSSDETILIHLFQVERASDYLKQAGGLSRQSRSEVAVGSNGRRRGGGSPSHRSHRRPGAILHRRAHGVLNHETTLNLARELLPGHVITTGPRRAA